MNLRTIFQSDPRWSLTIIRIPAGLVFAGHGWIKFNWFGGGWGLDATADLMLELGLPLPYISAVLLTSAETFGGALLVIGFLTRPAALALAFAMFVAIFWAHWDNGMFARPEPGQSGIQGGYEWVLMLFSVSLALLLEGAGRFSVDRAMVSRLWDRK
jgi:putative oxidoreductase